MNTILLTVFFLIIVLKIHNLCFIDDIVFIENIMSLLPGILILSRLCHFQFHQLFCLVCEMFIPIGDTTNLTVYHEYNGQIFFFANL